MIQPQRSPIQFNQKTILIVDDDKITLRLLNDIVTRLGYRTLLAGSGVEALELIVEMPPDLFQMVHMKADLEAILDAPVDLIRYHKYLDAFLRSQIDRDAVYV